MNRHLINGLRREWIAWKPVARKLRLMPGYWLRRSRRRDLRSTVLAIAALIVLGMVAISYAQWRQYSRANRDAAASIGVQDSVDTLISALLNGESEERGYLLTGQSQYLVPYNRATREIPGDLAQLNALLAARPAQFANIAPLDRLVNQKLNEMRQSVSAAQAGHGQDALAIVLSNQGKRQMDEIRALGEQIQRAERSTRVVASAGREAAATTALVITVAGSMVLLLLFAFGLEPFASGDPQARARSWTVRYGAAVLAVIAATILRAALTPLIGPVAIPGITFFPAVLFAAWYGGFRAGILSTALSVSAVAFFFAGGTFPVHNRTDLVALLIFVLSGFAISLMSLSQGRAIERAAQAQAAERTERRRFDMALRAGQMAALEVRNDSAVRWYSPEVYKILGVDSARFVPTREAFLELVHPEDKEGIIRAFEESVAGHKPLAHEFRIIRPDGALRWIGAWGQNIYDPQGRFQRHFGVTADITDRKQMEKEKEARLVAEERLRATTEAKMQVENTQESLRRLSVRLMNAQDEERRRIARELHDSVGQHLAHAKLSVELFLEKPNGQSDFEDLVKVIEALDECIVETRTISHLLHPPLLDELGFVAAAKVYAEGFANRSGIAVDLCIPPNLPQLTHDQALVLFRLLQEALTNVMRHARCQSVQIRVECDGGTVSVAVKDGGTGMSKELVERILAGRGGGVGLSGMRERILQFGGHFEIDSSPRGTLLRVTMPLAAAHGQKPAA